MPHKTFTTKLHKRTVRIKKKDGSGYYRYSYLSILIPKPIQDSLDLKEGDTVVVRISKVSGV